MFTSHAQKRLQQRGISIEKVEAVLLYGEEFHVNNSTSYKKTKVSEAMMLSDGVKPSFVDECRGIYVVCSGSTIVTVCHKH